MVTTNPRIIKGKETRNRRKMMEIKTYELKIQNNKLSTVQNDKLYSYFQQAKWLKNDIIASGNPFTYDYKTKQVTVRWLENKQEKSDIREITLPSCVKQLLLDNIKMDIYTLAKCKRKGIKVGKLKFKKEVTTIFLRQYGIRHSWCFGKKNKVRIAGLGYVSVNGMDQITKDIKEFGPAKLIRKPDGFYIQVTCWKEKIEVRQTTIEPKDIVGIDFGIKDNIVLSTGEKLDFNVPIPKSLKRLQRKCSKSKKKSKNRRKLQHKIRQQFQKITNKKNDKTNKFISKMKSTYKRIFIQDENIVAWQESFFGLQIFQSCLGRIKSGLKKLNTTTMIGMYEPTTQLCPMCGLLNKHNLSQRQYNCSCGFSEDRDIKSAKTVVLIGLDVKYIGMEHTNFKPAEILTSTFREKYNLLFNKGKLASMKQEDKSINDMSVHSTQIVDITN
jgi:putative transposase